MKIERAVREKTYTLTSIAGPSGSGKTYSALLYARGLVGPEGKIGFIDTENKRSRFYADVAGGFDVIDLDPPFTSGRYIEAIKAFEKVGYTAIVVDSISHEWEGSGGVLEQAEAIEERTKRAGLHCWQKPKAGHKKLMNELLQTRAHLIFCCRVKEKVVQAKGRDGKTEIINEGFVVVQEKSFIYEMTVSMMLEEGTHVPLLQKCPGDLLSAFPQGSRVTTQIGTTVSQWANEGRAVDIEVEDAKREGLLIANQGVGPLTEWWKALTSEKKKFLETFKDTLKSIASAHDQMLADQMDAGGGDITDRIAAARKAAGDTTDGQEGFNRDFVRQQTQGASVGRADLNNTNSDDETPAPSSDDAGMTPVNEAGADDVPASDAPASNLLRDQKWLLNTTRMLWGATKAGGDPEVFKNQRLAAMDQFPKPDDCDTRISEKANSVSRHCREIIDGALDPEDGLAVIAGIVGVDQDEILRQAGAA
ncbi:ATP-binding protein [Rhizobium pusense]|uniref:AAA family ATPase n=1 Tax=Agrobacterium pusense TaxID=648995 RepID=UPI00244C152A|nr:AAA family ATPase [Agrobacterium pusense]MDH2092698.1 ATP-binding protein [Agrobacterium pusense]